MLITDKKTVKKKRKYKRKKMVNVQFGRLILLISNYYYLLDY